MAVKAADQMTVVDLTDGYSVNLTNDSFTFAGDKDGKIAVQQQTTTVIQALRGDEEPTVSVNSSAIIKPTGVNVSYASNTKTVTITVTTSVTAGGVVTIPVVLDGDVTVNKTFSFSIAKTGATGQQGPKGDQGEKGETGETGPKGDTGAKGDPGADAITMALTSSAGTIFKNSDIATVITAHVYKAGAEVTGTALTNLGTISWKINGSAAPASKSSGTANNTLTISAGDVTNKAIISAELN